MAGIEIHFWGSPATSSSAQAVECADDEEAPRTDLEAVLQVARAAGHSGSSASLTLGWDWQFRGGSA